MLAMSLVLNCVYILILLFASPILVYRMLRYGKYRDGWAEKFLGRLPVSKPDTVRRAWFHAVSVGEVLQLQVVISQFEQTNPDTEIVVTTTTVTGLAVAREKFSQHTICYFPLDFSWAVRNAVRRIQPSLVVLVELELWPNFIQEVHRKGIPLALINGRMSEKRFRGYRKIRPLIWRLLQRFDLLAMQNDVYAQRLTELGSPAEKTRITGSIKFDGVNTDRMNPRTTELRTTFGITDDEPVFVAGSTHAPEEEIALNAWQKIREEFPKLRLVLIPRHQERFDEVARFVESRNLSLLRRSNQKTAKIMPQQSEELPVLLLDTLGELSACWGLADVAFVGGSLTPRGGQNMIEPAGFGAAVFFGPETRNFRDVVEVLLDANAAGVVQNEDELADVLRECLRDRNKAIEQGQRAKDVVLSQQGATETTVSLIGSLLSTN
jgi:3-deoxy-D-manno-octulosonic-acid transferase